MRWICSSLLNLAAFALVGRSASAQERPQHSSIGYSLNPALALAQLIATIRTAPGGEASGASAVGGITRLVPDMHQDRLGNFIVTRGSGGPRRVVACPLDASSYVVSEITDDGFLRLHTSGHGHRHPLWDQFHEGQRIVVAARSAKVPGVIAVRSTHLWRGRSVDEAPASIDDFWVDIGASSRAEAESLGVRVLQPVARELRPWSFGSLLDIVAGPAMGTAAGCAAVIEAARHTPSRGQTTFILSAGSQFSYGGLAAALSGLGPLMIDSLFIIDRELADADPGEDRVLIQRLPRPPFVLAVGTHIRGTVVIAPHLRYAGTLVEAISSSEMAALHLAVSAAAGERLGEDWSGSRLAATAPAVTSDSLESIANLLGTLTNTYGVSGHEGRVREAVLQALPEWARHRAVTDTAGNLVVAVGPPRDTAVFIAHLDEIGFEVTRIGADGTVFLRPRGGFFASLWEGQPAIVHLDSAHPPIADARCEGALPIGDLRGIFIPRTGGFGRQPPTLTAWFGIDSSGLAERGVGVGASVTGFKCASRLSRTRFTARSIDDRAGSAALIFAARALDPAKLDHAVLFVWSTREEIGLEGAAAVAATFGKNVHRVYAIDTFVSSDSPLETQRFAFAAIGRGAVVRGLDNSSVTPPEEVDRVVRLAAQAAIPLQVGTTNGGNDGSEFVRYGALDIPLSWPLRYSHSPAEVIDLRDVVSLARLIARIAIAH
ncbi:MAG: hypothetical protein NVS4B3_12560 [Gemmatimonadaceae bacterium]